MDVDLAIAGDVCYVLSGMLPLIEEKKHPDWMKMIHEWQAQDYHPVSDPTRLMPHQVIGEVCSQCGPEAVYVTDVGQHQMWAAQYIRHTKSRGFITSGGLGTMGFGLWRGHRRADGAGPGAAGGHVHGRRFLPHEPQ